MTSPNQKPMQSKVADKDYPDRRIFPPKYLNILRLFDWIWRILWWFWTSVIIAGVVVGLSTSILINGIEGITDPRKLVFTAYLLQYPALSTLTLALLLILTSAGYLAHRVLIKTGEVVTETGHEPSEPSEEQRLLEQRLDRLRQISKWARKDPKLWKSLRDVVHDHRKQQITTWLSEDSDLLDGLGNIVDNTQPKSWSGRFKTIGGLIAVATAFFTLVSLIISIFHH